MMKSLLSIEHGIPLAGEAVPPVAYRAGLARMGCNAGFTMIELMIVVAIIAILAAIAVPAYSNYVVKAHRVAAEGCLSEYANYMERYYTTYLRYNNDGAGNANTLAAAALDCATPQRTGANYNYDLPSSSLSVSSYTVTATPINGQLARDTKCGTLSIDQAGTRSPTLEGCW